MTDVAGLRQEIRGLARKYRQGDISRRDYERTLAERTNDLFRAMARERLGRDEPIVAEHHAALGHLRLYESILKAPEEECISLFATDRRLVRVLSRQEAGAPPPGAEKGAIAVHEIAFADISAIRTRGQIRKSEIVAGVVIAALALLFRPFLQVTGLLMAGLGVAGALHGLLLPTRWIEVEARGAPPEPPFRIYARRRKSARKLVAHLRSASLRSVPR